jgi:hypothetical protein
VFEEVFVVGGGAGTGVEGESQGQREQQQQQQHQNQQRECGRRKEREWSGEWNRGDMEEVVRALRGLRS